ncbi:MAG: indolepyruvate ferredoxin oxidoreductase family protein, partial [Burkholderiales bacterium]|nr:indolepyruvate ferredoxin oxidoreductase family protein [Burkholderiales bacterium]
TREFATGLQEILVVEEKRQVIEYQLKEELYNWRSDVRPVVLGKFNEADEGGGEWSVPNPRASTLLRANADLNPSLIAKAIAQRLLKLGVDADVASRINAQLAIITAKEQAMSVSVVTADRQPWFCSGCPHNTSTKVPEGSRAMAGIGCHFMSLWMDRSTAGFTQMGGEGTPWVGQQPFVNDQHIFANIGDGTYFHSGILAVRQSVAAGVNITYKILYNDAVAMTGGQPIGERSEGHTTLQIAQSMRAEGAKRIAIVTDEPEKYEGADLVADVNVYHRTLLDQVQREMREVKGCTVIIYDQTCATEKRRRRKRGTMVDPAVRVLINDLVCEGCGDCGVQSNCLSVEPLETEFGRKRTINQNTCNKDVSCLKGFCPSFVTVEGGQLKKKAKGVSRIALPEIELPLPTLPKTQHAWGTVVAGVGGTGVITIGQLLGMAAHIEGKGIVTQDSAGLAQKGGATWSHVLIADDQEAIRTTRVSMAAADLIIGCDPIVSAGKETLQRMLQGRTHVALNAYSTPTAAFVKNANWQNPAEQCAADIANAVGLEGLSAFDANRVSTQVLGDTIYINPMLLGFAWQKGWVPLGHEALVRAIELNDVAVAQNIAAFEWGRHCAHHWNVVEALLAPAQVIQFHKPQGVDALVAKRVAFLTDYQNASYAKRYSDVVARVKVAEAAFHKTSLSEAVARNLFKLMAYKDEYEVARLHTNTAFLQKIGDMFEGDYTVNYHLAPPIISKTNEKGELQKQKFGPLMLTGFKLLKHFKVLRATPLDIFGNTEEREMERALIGEYVASIDEVLAKLNADNHALALEIANLPDAVKGFGHVKARNVVAVRSKWDGLMEKWRS